MKEVIDKADREAREKRTRTGAAAARCGSCKYCTEFSRKKCINILQPGCSMPRRIEPCCLTEPARFLPWRRRPLLLLRHRRCWEHPPPRDKSRCWRPPPPAHPSSPQTSRPPPPRKTWGGGPCMLLRHSWTWMYCKINLPGWSTRISSKTSLAAEEEEVAEEEEETAATRRGAKYISLQKNVDQEKIIGQFCAENAD